MAVNYLAFPPVEAWKKDSNVTLATRAKDTVLIRIDELLDLIKRSGDGSTTAYLTCDLFFTLDYWLKEFKKNSNMEKGREPAIMGLYRFTVEELGRNFAALYGRAEAITPNNLHAVLELFYGRTLGAHGVELDLQKDCALYLSRAEVNKYKIIFKEGKAYQLPWWKDSGGNKLVLANSKCAENTAVFGRKNWGGFAMNIGRDLFMARHYCTGNPGEKINFYHSSYMGGGTVMLAGTMLIEDGRIRGFATDSGHYQPDIRNVINLLDTLIMHGVDISEIEVSDYRRCFIANGDVYRNANGNWNVMLERGRLNYDHQLETALKAREFGDRVFAYFQDAISRGYIRDDVSGRAKFIGQYLINRKGYNSEYVLDALMKAISRNNSLDADNWYLINWREFLKSKGLKNTISNIGQFADYIIKMPGYEHWDKNATKAFVELTLKRMNHKFDS